MLHISDNRVNDKIEQEDYDSFKTVSNKYSYSRISRIIFGSALFAFLCLFLPWTQNISTNGYVTSLRPEQRPHTIVSRIPGRMEEWHVHEGQLVDKGDTIITISEIKSEYLDTNLLVRMDRQIEAKNNAIYAYELKIQSLDNQNSAINQGRNLKLRQAKNKLKQVSLKIQADSISYEAAKIYATNMTDLKNRNEKLYNSVDGALISKTKWQAVVIKEQDAQSKLIEKQNKYESSINKLINAEIELLSINTSYMEKSAKNRSDFSSASSTLADAHSSLAKLQNKRSNYSRREEYRTIIAPQDGYITKAIKTGVGGIVKEGESLVTIMPKNHDLAAELYISAIDLPLMGLNHEVNLIFDGWPVIAVPGWPDAVSYGTFKGEIVAIDNMISSNGKYRILISPEEGTKQWPHALRLGSGVKGFALLNDVPIYREVWRQMNGFPADFYDEYQEDHIIKHRREKGKKKK